MCYSTYLAQSVNLPFELFAILFAAYYPILNLFANYAECLRLLSKGLEFVEYGTLKYLGTAELLNLNLCVLLEQFQS